MAFDPSDQEFYEDLWRRIMASQYTRPIEVEGGAQGFDIIAMVAAIWERFDQAANRSQQGYYLKPHSIQTAAPSSGAILATGPVEIARAANAEGAIDLAAGTILEAHGVGSRGQDILLAEFELSAALTIPAGSLGPLSAAVAARRPGRESNVPANRITLFKELGRADIACTVDSTTELQDTGSPDLFTEAMLTRYVRLVGLPSGVTFPRRIVGVTPGPTTVVVIDPPLAAGDVGAPITAELEEWADLGLTVDNAVATDGGRPAMLDQIGSERNLGRVTNEGDDLFRDRVCSLPDIISPAAIERICTRILGPAGISFVIKETRGPGLVGFIYDVDPFDVGELFPTATVLPGAESNVTEGGHVLLSAGEATRFFIICVSPGNAGEFGVALDVDPWDIGALDGFPAEYGATIAALEQQVREAKLGGVRFIIIRNFDLPPAAGFAFAGAFDVDPWDVFPLA